MDLATPLSSFKSNRQISESQGSMKLTKTGRTIFAPVNISTISKDNTNKSQREGKLLAEFWCEKQTSRSVAQQLLGQQRHAQTNRSQEMQNSNATNKRSNRLTDDQPSSQDIMARLVEIRYETIEDDNRYIPIDIPMSPTERMLVGNALQNFSAYLIQMNGLVVDKWFSLTHNEQVLRQFFRNMDRMRRQFDTQNVLKPAFSLTLEQVRDAHALAKKMMKETIVDVLPIVLKPGTAGNATPHSTTLA